MAWFPTRPRRNVVVTFLLRGDHHDKTLAEMLEKWFIFSFRHIIDWWGSEVNVKTFHRLRITLAILLSCYITKRLYCNYIVQRSTTNSLRIINNTFCDNDVDRKIEFKMLNKHIDVHLRSIWKLLWTFTYLSSEAALRVV